MVTGGVIHSYDLSKTSVYNIKELKDNKPFYHNCSILEDKGYISAENQLDILILSTLGLNVHIGLSKRTEGQPSTL